MYSKFIGPDLKGVVIVMANFAMYAGRLVRGLPADARKCIAGIAHARLIKTPLKDFGERYDEHDVSMACALLSYCMRYGVPLREARCKFEPGLEWGGELLAAAMFSKAHQIYQAGSH